MSKNADQVISGARNASSATVSADELRRPAPRIALADEPKAPYPTRFQSTTQSHIVTLNVRTRNNDGTMKDNKFNVMFSNGFVDITRKPYPFAPDIVSEKLQACSGYGLGKSFWDADQFAAVAKKTELEQFIERAKQVAGDAEGRAALKAVLGDSFDLPAKPADDGEPAPAARDALLDALRKVKQDSSKTAVPAAE